MTDPRRGPARYRALWRPGVRLRCAVATIPLLGRVLQRWAPAIARHAWQSYRLEPVLGWDEGHRGALDVCLICGRLDAFPLRWRPTRGEIEETWWSLVALIPGSWWAVERYERATGGASRAIAHRLGWHAALACRGRRECGPELDGKVAGYLEHPWLPWFRWTTS